MNTTRRAVLLGGIALTAGIAVPVRARAAKPAITVYKTPTCGCCREWVAHVVKSGFSAKAEDHADLAPIKRKLGVPSAVWSCHTAVVDGYVVEGHVPADLIDRLLAERPKVTGLAVPGMPIGSPGMEVPGRPADRYKVLTFESNGRTEVFASR